MARTSSEFSAERPSLEYLRHRGPHPVVEGDLSPIGLPGLVFAPHTGPRVPAVAFARGYLQPVRRYVETLRFLASWGFVVAAPETERGPLPSHRGMALDLRRTLDRLAEAKLNNGRVTVDRKRLAVLGHGIGAGAAVLAAAAGAPHMSAAAVIFAAPTSPPAIQVAPQVTIPGLHFIAAKESVTRPEEGEALAAAWGGPTVVRQVRGAHHLDPAEGKHITSTLLNHRNSAKATATIRTVTVAFLLHHLAHQEQLAEALS